MGRPAGPNGPLPGSALSSSSPAGSSLTPTSSPNRPAYMLPLTKAPRLPNIGLTSTPGASVTRLRKCALASSVCLGIFTRPSHHRTTGVGGVHRREEDGRDQRGDAADRPDR